MAKSFKEIGGKAEAIIEQGKEADQEVQSCQDRVATSNSWVAAAERQLAAASETDEEGNPVGDVKQARAQLNMAENQLAASQRALSSARGVAERVRQQKNARIQKIEKYSQVERSNLEKLRRLRSSAFGANSAALAEGIAQRLNEAEDARIALLQSMGIDATPDYVSTGQKGGADYGWLGGGFAALDTTGQAQSYQGGGSEGLPSGSGIAAPRFIRENWMNNFNADEWKRILPGKLYKERLELYRKGVATVIGDDLANTLSTEDLEQLSRVQNHAYLSGCQLNGTEISELYRSAVDHRGNFVTRRIEYKMDKTLQERAHGLLQTEKYKQSTWQGLSVTEKKGVLRDLLIDMNSVLNTNVSTDIDFFYEQSGSRGAYSSSSNSVKINEYILAKDSSYQLTQTILHEMRHAYQHHSITNEQSVLVSSQTLKAWENNFNNYKSPSSGSTFEEYLSQPVEWDAKNFAKQYTDIMGINPGYEGSWS